MLAAWSDKVVKVAAITLGTLSQFSPRVSADLLWEPALLSPRMQLLILLFRPQPIQP